MVFVSETYLKFIKKSVDTFQMAAFIKQMFELPLERHLLDYECSIHDALFSLPEYLQM